MELGVSCKEELKAKVHTVVYTKEHEEDEESISSNHVTIQNEYDSLPQKKIEEEVEDIVCIVIYQSMTMILWKRKIVKMLHQNLKNE